MIVLFVALQFGVVFCQNHYTNHWAVKIDGGIHDAKRVALEHGFTFVSEIVPGYYSFRHHSIRKRSVGQNHHHHSKLISNPKVEWAEQQIARKRVKRDLTQNSFNDPLWPDTWYMHSPAGNDMHVLDVYNTYNITGRNVHVTILDDGLEKDHPDLKRNYDPESSYDVNDQDNDPQPKYDINDENRHGTRCAGEVSAEADNNICSVGIAYDARIGGIRMLDGDVTDAVEAQSLGLNPQHIDIYSVSWGPEDNGMTVDGPGPLARQAFFNGIYKGRNKLGSIFVWASGNGGLKGDSCSCDGYTNSIYTLSISSASESGQVPWYSEPCASTLASTYSSGSMNEQQIVTTDIRKRCTTTHTGTSASAPLAAGICALVLEANPGLTWRDMQYIVFLTARKANLVANDWIVNGVGREVSHHFGYGLMDASAMVEAALHWTPLPDHHRCVTFPNKERSSFQILAGSSVYSSITTNGCRNTLDAVVHLEHVECVVTLQAVRRGEVEIFVTSPKGTRSQLLIKRSADRSNQGFSNWSFMTTHSWGEDPSGEWKLEVKNYLTTSILVEWSLTFYGVATVPSAYDKYLRLTPPGSDRPPATNSTNHSARFAKETVVALIKESELSKLCSSSEFLYKGTCVTSCPSGYYESLLDRVCEICKDGCISCTRQGGCVPRMATHDNDKWYIAIGAVCILMVVTIASAVLLIACLWRRRKFKYQDDVIPGLNRNSNRLMHRTTFHPGLSGNGRILSIEAIKKPLLNKDPLSSEDDQCTRPNTEP